MPSGFRPEAAVSPWRAFRDVSLVLAVTVGVIVGMAFLPTFGTQDAQASVGPRPTVELVKVFSCNLLRWNANHCAPDIENQANAWLQSKQPGIRISEQLLTSSKDGIFLVIFYEVPEWRTKGQDPAVRPPAEAVR